MKEIISLHVGQAGAQLGAAVWELLTAEHAIDRGGTHTTSRESNSETFFSQSTSGKAVPRGLFIDLEPTVLDQIRKGSYANLFNPFQLINSNEDSSSNFARAYYTVGRLMYGKINNELRRQIEGCDYIYALMIFRALAGGCGSGLTSMIIEMLEEYSKTTRIEFPIHPAPHFDSVVVGPYNSILAEHFCLDHCDVGLLLDNEALFDICTKNLEIKSPTMTSINRILAQVYSSLTASTRFHNNLSNDVTLVLTNLVPYPRIHFPLVSYAPFGNMIKNDHEENTCTALTKAVFECENQLVKCDPLNGKYMSCSLVYRGMVSPCEVYSTLGEIKKCSKYRFVDWCPTGFKVGIVDQPPLILPQSYFGDTQTNVVMMTNSSAISSIWQRLAQKFHTLYSKKSFIHWFVSEGLEENEFCEALYNIATLAKDYEEVSLDTNAVTNTITKTNIQNTVDEGEGVEPSIIITKESEDSETSTQTKTSKEESSDSNESNINRNSNVYKSKCVRNYKKGDNKLLKENKKESFTMFNYSDLKDDNKSKTSPSNHQSVVSSSSLEKNVNYCNKQFHSQPWLSFNSTLSNNTNNKMHDIKPSTNLQISYAKDYIDEESQILKKLISFTSTVYH